MTHTIRLMVLVISMGALGALDAQAQVRVETLSGTGQAGLADGNRQVGQLNRPHGLAVLGNAVYVSDRGNHAIRIVAANGDIRTLAGNGKDGKIDGVGAAASFNQPIAVAVDRSGNVYVADRDNHTIRLVDPSGKVTVVAGTGAAGLAEGPATSAQFNQPYGVALSSDERILYIADYLNHAIRALDLGTKRVTTLVGNGKAGFANGKGDHPQFNQPYNVKIAADGRLFVPDQNNHAIRRIDQDGTVSTVAGNGQSGFANGRASDARFNNPTGLILAADGSIYVADRNNQRLRVVSPGGEVTTIAGDGTEGFQDGAGPRSKFIAGMDANNNVTGLQVRLSGQSILASVAPARLQNGRDPATFQGFYPGGTEGAFGYDIPNLLVDHAMRNPHVPAGFWRGVNNNQNAIFQECFVDELAHLAGHDQLEFRRKMMAKHPKHLAVLNAAAEKAGWGTPAPQGVFRGLAQQMGYGSYVAACAEISVEGGNRINIHRVVGVTDCGHAVNPWLIERQITGSFVFGLSALFYGACTVKDGRIEQTNFDGYNVMRIREMPKVETVIMPSGGFWGGVGEPTIFVAAPAVLNAFFAATGKRIRSFPLKDHSIRMA